MGLCDSPRERVNTHSKKRRVLVEEDLGQRSGVGVFSSGADGPVSASGGKEVSLYPPEEPLRRAAFMCSWRQTGPIEGNRVYNTAFLEVQNRNPGEIVIVSVGVSACLQQHVKPRAGSITVASALAISWLVINLCVALIV
jgi:hypothetical protein